MESEKKSAEIGDLVEEWAAAENDVKKFEIIVKISKIKNFHYINYNHLRSMFRKLDASFFKRLHHDLPEDISLSLIKDVVSKILVICEDIPEILYDDCMIAFIEPLYIILKENISVPISESLMCKLLCCLSAIVINENCRSEIMKHDFFSNLCDLYCRDIFGKNLITGILIRLGKFGIESTSSNQESFDLFLQKIVSEFLRDTPHKFALCSEIYEIIYSYSDLSLKIETVGKIISGVLPLLLSRLAKEQRDNVLKLSSILLEKKGSSLFLSNDIHLTRKFFIVVVQISCVEIKMLLEEKSITEVINDMSLLGTCYIIFEHSISILVADDFIEDVQDNFKALLNSVKMAMDVILEFLTRTQSDYTVFNFISYGFSETGEISPAELNPQAQILFATLRVVGAWLVEDTLIVQDKVLAIFPYILKVCKEWFWQFQEGKPHMAIDPIRFLILPINHLITDSRSREMLLNNDLLNLLLHYFGDLWDQFKYRLEESIIQTFNSLCSIFLNIVVMEPSLAADNNDLFSVWNIIITDLPDKEILSSVVTMDSGHIILKAHFVALGLLITKSCGERVKNRETMFYPFLSASVKFLWDAHVATQDHTFCLTRKYKETWEDISELWFLGMQALESLLSIMTWISSFIVESGWLEVILDAFSKVSASGIDGNVKSAYQGLLSALVRSSSDDIAQMMIEKNTICVCEKLDLHELKNLLKDRVK